MCRFYIYYILSSYTKISECSTSCVKLKKNPKDLPVIGLSENRDDPGFDTTEYLESDPKKLHVHSGTYCAANCD